jgi:hypothetical protein
MGRGYRSSVVPFQKVSLLYGEVMGTFSILVAYTMSRFVPYWLSRLKESLQTLADSASAGHSPQMLSSGHRKPNP